MYNACKSYMPYSLYGETPLIDCFCCFMDYNANYNLTSNNIVSVFTHPLTLVVTNLYDFLSLKHSSKSLLLSVQQKKEIHTGLE